MSSLLSRLWGLTFGRSQFLRFGLVGVAGYVVDAAVLTGLVEAARLDPYSARVASFLCAASTTWWLNRHFTFARNPEQKLARQWLGFLLVSTGGAVINYGAYVVTLQLWPLAYDYPAIGAAVGALAGMLFNFPVSKLLVFRTGLPAPSVARDNER
ncbi:MAG: GtrA family protein [Reyranellaceae bacterium]